MFKKIKEVINKAQSDKEQVINFANDTIGALREIESKCGGDDYQEMFEKAINNCLADGTNSKDFNSTLPVLLEVLKGTKQLNDIGTSLMFKNQTDVFRAIRELVKDCQRAYIHAQTKKGIDIQSDDSIALALSAITNYIRGVENEGLSALSKPRTEEMKQGFKVLGTKTYQNSDEVFTELDSACQKLSPATAPSGPSK